MEKIIANKTIIIFIVFILFLILERIFSFRQYPKSKRLFRNLSLFSINGINSYLIILPITLWFTTLNFWHRDSSLLNTIINLLVLDIWIYWWHRLNHIIPFLWRFHLVHHLDEHLDTTSAVRFHFGEVFFSALARGPIIILLAIPFSDILIFETLLLVCAIFHHSNLKMHPVFDKFLSWFIVTPGLHWIHHHSLRKDTDSNYGLFLSFWDRIFRSKSKTQKTPELKLGVEGLKDTTIPKLLIKPFTKQKTNKKK